MNTKKKITPIDKNLWGLHGYGCLMDIWTDHLKQQKMPASGAPPGIFMESNNTQLHKAHTKKERYIGIVICKKGVPIQVMIDLTVQAAHIGR